MAKDRLFNEKDHDALLLDLSSKEFDLESLEKKHYERSFISKPVYIKPKENIDEFFDQIHFYVATEQLNLSLLPDKSSKFYKILKKYHKIIGTNLPASNCGCEGAASAISSTIWPPGTIIPSPAPCCMYKEPK
jgi:hypothetical protein